MKLRSTTYGSRLRESLETRGQLAQLVQREAVAYGDGSTTAPRCRTNPRGLRVGRRT